MDSLTLAGRARHNPVDLRQSPTTSSPVPHLILSNDPPSEEDVELIEQAISIAKSHILNHQTGQNECHKTASSDSQQSCIDGLQDFIRVHRSLCSVIRTIPPEIWTLVFEHSLVDYARGCPNTSQVMKFTFVCRLWRSIALSNSRLWGNLPCFFFTARRSLGSEYFRHAQELLKRGHETPISFHANARFTTVQSQSNPLLNLLVSQSHRWKHVILETAAMTMEALTINGKIPLLHTLELDVTNLKALPKVITVFKDAPSLRVVKIKGVWPLKLELPWHQLENYTEDGAGLTGLRYILQHSANLQSLSCPAHGRLGTYADLPRVVFTKLTSLQVHHYEYGDSYGPLLERLTLPALTEMKVFNRAGELVDELIGLIRRSQCSLQGLTFFTFPHRAQAGKLTELLLLTSSLKKLDVDDIPSEDLECLLQPVVVPHLHSLTVHFNTRTPTKPLSVDDQGLNALAQFRCSRDRTSATEGDCRQLDVFRLMFQSSDHCLSSQATLEGWNNAPRSQSVWETLLDCAKGLEQMLPHQLSKKPSSRTNMLELNISRLQTIICNLEDLSDIDPRVILHSNVIYHLQKLKQPLVFDRIPDTGQRYFAEAEASLRQKWTMYAGKRGFVLNWIRKGQQSLTYIPDVAKAAIGVEGFLYGVT